MQSKGESTAVFDSESSFDTRQSSLILTDLFDLGLCISDRRVDSASSFCRAQTIYIKDRYKYTVTYWLSVYSADRGLLESQAETLRKQFPGSTFLLGDSFMIWLNLDQDAPKYKSQVIDDVLNSYGLQLNEL